MKKLIAIIAAIVMLPVLGFTAETNNVVTVLAREDNPESLRAAAKLLRATAAGEVRAYDKKQKDEAERMAISLEKRAKAIEETLEAKKIAVKTASSDSENIAVRAWNNAMEFIPTAIKPEPKPAKAPVLVGETTMTAKQKNAWSDMVLKYDSNGDGKLDSEERARMSVADRKSLRDAGF